MSENEDRSDKFKIDIGDVSATVYPADDGEYVKPSIHISEKPKEHEQQPTQHHFERKIKVGEGASFGFSEKQVGEINSHLAWLRSKYFTEMRP